jgi:hypothetical protein
VTETERELLSFLDECQESLASISEFAAAMSAFSCGGCGRALTPPVRRSHADFSFSTARAANLVAALKVRLTNDIRSRDAAHDERMVELASLRQQVDLLRRQRGVLSTDAPAPLPAAPVQLTTHDFNERGVCRRCNDGRASLRPCPGEPKAEAPAEYHRAIEID